MAIYVDSLMNWGWKYGKSCHMVADSLEELHEFAGRLGMKMEWFQGNHYDLTEKKRKLALELGVKEIDRKGLIKLLRILEQQD